MDLIDFIALALLLGAVRRVRLPRLEAAAMISNGAQKHAIPQYHFIELKRFGFSMAYEA